MEGANSADDEFDETLDAFRRRAVSEVVRQSASRWRIVAAWTSLRRSWDKRDSASPTESIGASDLDEPSDLASTPLETEGRPPLPPRTSTEGGRVSTASGDAQRPRKRVSLFLRRRGRFRDGVSPQSAYVPPAGEAEGAPELRFRRAQSHFEKPVSFADGTTTYVPGGEGGRYLQYASEFDGAEFEQLRRRTRKAFRKLRPAAIRLAPGVAAPGVPDVSPDEQNSAPKRVASAPPERDPPRVPATTASVAELAETFGGMHTDVAATCTDGVADGGEIIGEICLEDYADGGSEDFDFLDGQIVDVWTDGDGEDGRPSLRLDAQHMSLFGEEEFAAFVKEVGLHQLFERPTPTENDWSTFRVDDAVVQQWRDDSTIHNVFAARWASLPNAHSHDVRAFARAV